LLSWIIGRFSALFSSAALVKLKDPVITVSPSMTMDLIMGYGVLSVYLHRDSLVRKKGG
jgi:hypothetical protein